MNKVTSDIAQKFCDACNWSYECWVTHKTLFDNNDKKKETIEKERSFFHRLHSITLEYSVLQICKLHEPSRISKNDNLTIAYMVECGEWESDQKNRLKELQTELVELYNYIKIARDKVVAHLDLETIRTNMPVGSFAKEMDVQYFTTLQEFVTIVAKKWLNGSFELFNDLAEADAEDILDVLIKISTEEKQMESLRRHYEKTS